MGACIDGVQSEVLHASVAGLHRGTCGISNSVNQDEAERPLGLLHILDTHDSTEAQKASDVTRLQPLAWTTGWHAQWSVGRIRFRGTFAFCLADLMI